MTKPKFDREFFVTSGRKGGQTFKEWFAALTQEQKDAFLAPAREAYKRKVAEKKANQNDATEALPN